MYKKPLGKTGLETSILGIGGFHLLEILQEDAASLLNTYLDYGGNYIETAADYGNGLSEQKIGLAVSARRDDFILASKCSQRSKKEALRSIEKSLRNLKTDHLDILFMHAVQTIEEAEAILASDGAMQAAIELQKQGKIKFIGITGHGHPEALIHSIHKYPYDVLMTGFNYFDRFNFPSIEEDLVKECLERHIGLLAMKVLADGYLYRSIEPAIRYTLSLPVSTLVLGINTLSYLEKDLKIIDDCTPMDQREKEKLYYDAIELGNYVCRQCKKCDDKNGLKPSEFFLLEGEFDRQMDSGAVPDAAHYALTERLKHWFDQKETAVLKYQRLRNKVDVSKDYRYLNNKCPYGIDINKKLKYAHFKLTQNDYFI